MTVRLTTRSQKGDVEACEAALTKQHAHLAQGVEVLFSPDSQNGSVVINVESGKPTEFEVIEVNNFSVYTRFPVRLRAAATALRNGACFGTFVLSHNKGRLLIKSVNVV